MGFTGSTPAGGGFAAAMDLHRFVEALLAHRLLDAAHTALLLNGFEAGVSGIPDQIGYAGGAPGVSAVILASPGDRRSVIVLSNVTPSPAGPVARRILALPH